MSIVAWKVTYNGTDITEKLESISINVSIGEYCFQLNAVIADPTLLSTYAWNKIGKLPVIEVFIDNGSGTFTSWGTFFIEKPVYTYDLNRVGLSGFWGRSSHAILDTPFSAKFTKKYTEDMYTSAIIQKVLTEHGKGLVPFSITDVTSTDFVIPAGEFGTEEQTPIEHLSELMEILGKEIVPKKDGSFLFVTRNQTTTLSTAATTFDITNTIGSSTTIEVPEFGNRVRVTGTIGTGSTTFSFWGKNTYCWSENDVIEEVSKLLIGQITDSTKAPVNGLTVHWYLKDTGVAYNDLAEVLDPITTSLPYDTLTEVVNADSFRQFTLSFTPKKIHFITHWNSTLNKDYADNCSIEGNVVTLDRNLPLCDARIQVTYAADGIVKARVRSKGVVGDTMLVAAVGGSGTTAVESEVELFFHQTCQCPLSVEFISGGIIDHTYRKYEEVNAEKEFIPYKWYNGNILLTAMPKVGVWAGDILITNMSGVYTRVYVVGQGFVVSSNMLGGWYEDGGGYLVKATLTPGASFSLLGDYTYKQIKITTDELANTIIALTNTYLPIYVIAKQGNDTQNNQNISVKLLTGTSYARLTASSVRTSLQTIEEIATVKEIATGKYACDIKNNAVAVEGVYWYGGGSNIDYGYNRFVEVDANNRNVIYVNDSELDGQKVIVKYQLYAGILYATDIVSAATYISETTCEVEARIKALQEEPIVDKMSFEVQNPFYTEPEEEDESISINFEYAEDDGDTEIVGASSAEIMSNYTYDPSAGVGKSSYGSYAAGNLIVRNKSAEVTSGSGATSDKSKKALLSTASMVGVDKDGNKKMGRTNYKYDGDSKKFHPVGVILED